MTVSVQCDKSQASVSCCYRVSESTICEYLRDKEKLHDFVDKVDSTDQMKRIKATTAKDPQLDNVNFKWFVKEKQADSLISGLVFSIQAQKLPKEPHIDNPNDFDASKGRIHWFRCCSKELKTTKSYRFLQTLEIILE